MALDRRIASLDGLRGIAASAVVYAHVIFFYPSTSPWVDLHTGDEAVALFFCLSGFLMALLYGERPMAPMAITDYLVHRLARIYPVYLVSIVCVVALSAIYGADYLYPILGAGQIVRHVLFMGSTGVYWSIPPEIQFYVFFPLLWLWFLNPRKHQWVAVVTAIVLVVDTYFGFPGPGILLTAKLPYFLFGALAGRLFAVQKSGPDGPASGLAVLGLLAFFLLVRGVWPLQTSFWGVGSALTATIIVYLAAANTSISARILGSRPLVWVGRISFSLYLLHLPVIFLCLRLFRGVLPIEAALMLAIAIAYPVAWVSYRLIEEPCRRGLTGLWRYRQRRLAVARQRDLDRTVACKTITSPGFSDLTSNLPRP